MKPFTSSLVCTLCFSLISTACAQVGKVTVIVTDYETGEHLPGVRVGGDFSTGWGWGDSGKPNESECVTNSNGACTIWGHGNGSSVAVAVMNSSYFYGTTGEFFFKEGLGPIARPWNPTIELRLKAIRNPIAMYAKNLSQKRFPEAVIPRGRDPKKGWVPMPADSGTVRYDLEKGDWVEPYGEGTISDFVFTITREARVKYLSEYGRDHTSSGATIEISVSNDGDGFIPYPVAEKDRHRGLRLPYQVVPNGYEPVVKKHKIHPPNERTRTNIEKDMNYFFRVRTIKDEMGKIVSAHYGKIHGDFVFDSLGTWITFAYYLNPTPNDRNVEFKRKSSLIPDLKGTEDSLGP